MCWAPIKENEEQSVGIREEGWRDGLFQGGRLLTRAILQTLGCVQERAATSSITFSAVEEKQTDRLSALRSVFLTRPFLSSLFMSSLQFFLLCFYFSSCSPLSPPSFIRHSGFSYLYRKLLNWRWLTN